MYDHICIECEVVFYSESSLPSEEDKYCVDCYPYSIEHKDFVKRLEARLNKLKEE